MNSDKQAIKALKGENEVEIEAAFLYLYNKYSRLVFVCIKEIIKDHRDAEELTNDTFIRIFNNRKVLAEEKNIKYYFVVIAKHLAIDVVRKRNENEIYDNDFVYSQEDNSKTYELETIVEEMSKVLTKFECEIIIKHIVFGESFKNIADEVGKSESTVKSKYFRAIKKFQKEMREKYDEEDY